MQKPIIFTIFFYFFLTGCAATVTEAGYYWGDYARTLYDFEKTPSPETLEAHRFELESIIEESQKRDLRVPPGIHAELGYILLKEGDVRTGYSHYQAEMELYPESRLFLERLTENNSESGGGE